MKIERDIFGECSIQKSWGGIGSNRGNGACEPCGNTKAAQLRIDEIKNERLRRGYVLVDDAL